MRILVVVLMTIFLTAGCASSGVSLPTMQIHPTPGPVSPPPNPDPEPEEGRGSITVPGLERIPLSAIKLTNQEVAKEFAIMESGEKVDDKQTGNPDDHAKLVMRVACESFITGCEDALDFETTPYSWRSWGHLGDGLDTDTSADLEKHIDILAEEGIKLISFSQIPGPVGIGGADLPFVVVQSAGNDSTEEFFNEENVWYINQHENGVEKVKEAGAADKVLYVAGYTTNQDGEVVRDPKSTGCTGADEYCLYAPMWFQITDAYGVLSAGGTSLAAPNVSAALASVLAIFPDTEGVELIRLGKACAVAVPTLSGLGKADFTCMTNMGENGSWALVSDAEFASLVAPSAMRNMAFPGQSSMRASFRHERNGESITLGFTSPGSFARTHFFSGVPTGIPQQQGLSQLVAGRDSNYAVGAGLRMDNLFASVTWGERESFFGLGEWYGYRQVTALDASAGHPNLFLRVSHQWSDDGYLIKDAYGAAVGVTARAGHAFTRSLFAGTELSADRFLDGVADTAFGKVQIEESAWRGWASLSLAYTPSNYTNLSVQVGTPLTAEQYLGATLRFSHRF